ncbi:glycosyltransferase [Erythrobacter sp. HKB08]|uniref:glycosyltransferase n=1 Tax=Erythrobacter sp. HKB08 TaxID=2502843 RepID=UPI0010092591|nr:glycosyltransferase [Erythrobacter sp. HKB08]
MSGTVAFVWDNFGPLHVDRCNAVARALGQGQSVVGIEIFRKSDTYEWDNPPAAGFEKVTLFEEGSWSETGAGAIARAIGNALAEHGCEAVFFCHYDKPAILMAASRARMARRKVFTMGCSKFDDLPRTPMRELAKRQFLRPYQGAIASLDRSVDYFRWLGLDKERVLGGYNTVDQARIKALAGTPDAQPRGHADRPFLAVARLVSKKNLGLLLRAYARYRPLVARPRQLRIAGSGPLEGELKSVAVDLGIADHVDWLGFVQTDRVAREMRDALCLVLPSTVEQFGNVVPEALALALPVLASNRCGAADRLVLDGVSGFTFHPKNEQGLAALMEWVGADEALWLRLRKGAEATAPLGDTARFAESVLQLLAQS